MDSSFEAFALKPAPRWRWFHLRRTQKGIALFALAALANYRRLKTIEAETDARELLDELWQMRIQGYSGAAWGYNFAWQSRNFFAPQGTPTIVPTAFAARALIEAHQTFGDESYLKMARSSCDFILRDLKRTVEYARGSLFQLFTAGQHANFQRKFAGRGNFGRRWRD